MIRRPYWKTTLILSVLLAAFGLYYITLHAHPERNLDPSIKQAPSPPSTVRRFHTTVSPNGAQERLRTKSASLLQVGSSPCDHFEKVGVLQSWTGAKNECIEYTRKVPVLQTVLVRIADYLAWHNRTRSELLTPELHSDSKMQPTQLRTLTWRCPQDHPLNCNGYGDRILSMGYGLLYAALSERYYTIEWPHSYSNSDKVIRVFEPRVLQWDHQLNITSTGEQDSRGGRFLYTNPNTSEILSAIFADGSRYRHVCFNQHRLHYCVGTASFYLGKDVVSILCDTKKGHSIRRLVNGLLARLLLKFSSEVQDRANEMGFQNGPATVPICCSPHSQWIRRECKSVKIWKLNRNSNQWSMQLQQAVAVMNSIGLTYPIFLATDAAKVRTWVQQHYPGGKVVSSQLKVLHVAKDVAADDEEDDSYKENILQNAAELALLSRARVIVESRNSHFSLAAFLLSGLSHRTYK